MSRASLEAAIPPGSHAVLNTSVVLAYLNGNEAVGPAASIVVDDFVRTGRNEATISALTITETLVRPFNVGARELANADAFLMHFPGLQVDDIDYSIARFNARLRLLGPGAPNERLSGRWSAARDFRNRVEVRSRPKRGR